MSPPPPPGETFKISAEAQLSHLLLMSTGSANVHGGHQKRKPSALRTPTHNLLTHHLLTHHLLTYHLLTHHLLTHHLLTHHRLTHQLLIHHLRVDPPLANPLPPDPPPADPLPADLPPADPMQKIPTNLWTTDPSPANLLAKCRRDPLPSGLLTHQFACLHTGLQQESNATQHRLYGWHLTCWPAVLTVQKQTSWTAPLHGHLESQSNTLSTFCIFILNWPAPAPAVSRVTCMGSPDGLVQLTAQLTHCIRHA